jgi:hypothetical protein
MFQRPEALSHESTARYGLAREQVCLPPDGVWTGVQACLMKPCVDNQDLTLLQPHYRHQVAHR